MPPPYFAPADTPPRPRALFFLLAGWSAGGQGLARRLFNARSWCCRPRSARSRPTRWSSLMLQWRSRTTRATARSRPTLRYRSFAPRPPARACAPQWTATTALPTNPLLLPCHPSYAHAGSTLGRAWSCTGRPLSWIRHRPLHSLGVAGWRTAVDTGAPGRRHRACAVSVAVARPPRPRRAVVIMLRWPGSLLRTRPHRRTVRSSALLAEPIFVLAAAALAAATLASAAFAAAALARRRDGGGGGGGGGDLREPRPGRAAGQRAVEPSFVSPPPSTSAPCAVRSKAQVRLT
jgi:hypothetical protein